MDSITQVALGAAVGEATLGKKLGNRALLWGGALGTLPDLDVLVNPFVSEMQALALHRGLTHSLFFSVAAAPLLGLLVAHVHRRRSLSRLAATRFAFLALLTHILLDGFTTYPTQFFQPFSNATVSLSTIFIIDPLYTLPLVAALLLLVRRDRRDPRRRRAVAWGLGLSTLYLLFTFANKQYVSAVFERALTARGLSFERLHTAPTPFNNLLWFALADDGEGYHVGLYSLLDDGPPDAFLRVEKNHKALLPYRDQPPVERLLWFSDGFYAVTQDGPDLIFNDLRYGRTDLWMGPGGDYVFQFVLERDPHDPSRIVGFHQRPPAFSLDGAFWQRFFRRILGERDVRP